MSKKPDGRLLLTWNDEKHPEITEFFAEIEEGLYSYSVREAIKFYMRNKDKQFDNNSPEPSNEGVQGTIKQKSIAEDGKPRKSVDDDNYVDFDADQL